LETEAEKPTEEEKDYFSRVIGSTKRMEKMIDGLLTLSRISRDPLNIEEVN
jgi:hypothetical protein